MNKTHIIFKTVRLFTGVIVVINSLIINSYYYDMI